MQDARAAIATAVARQLLKIEAVALNMQEPYRYASGLISPIYCDNRLVLSYPGVRSSIIDAFIRTIDLNSIQFDLVAGTATAGIAHAAWIAQRLDKPMVYVRGSAKAHGAGRLIEGMVEPGQRALVVEDLISTGRSALHAAAALRDAGAVVEDSVAIFTYGLPQAAKNFAADNLSCHALSSFKVLLYVAVEQEYLTAEQAKKMASWAEDPIAWAKRWQEEQS